LSTGEQHLQAVCDRFTLELDLSPEKPPVVNGRDGISAKGAGAGQASHYISFTRLGTRGTLEANKNTQTVRGLAWMDHEYFSEQLNKNLTGWDWFAIQLDNNEELMLYRLRTKSGEPDPYSSGTFVDRDGSAHFLDAAQFSLSPGATWHSNHSGALYPVAWSIAVPSLQLSLSQQTGLEDQELYTPGSVSPSYWEGAVTYKGERQGRAIAGVGYLEMTGYGQPLRFGE
ncbi:MAG: hypothetical protein JO270_02650, partial [Acidobacteriaceae bacterium]|nr:hypothetical protein [Acidobacteriaceae bacterium]